MVSNIQRAARYAGDESLLAQRAVPAQVEEVPPRQKVRPTVTRYRSGQCEEPFLMCDQRIRTKQDPFQPTEDGSIRANAHRQAQNRQHRKSWAAEQLPKAVTYVLDKIIENSSAAGIPALLFNLRDSTHRK